MAEKRETDEEETIIIPLGDIDISRDAEEVLGRGGYGMVYSGHLIQTGEIVAVKLLINEGSLPKRNIRELMREARRLKKFTNHPNIVNMFGVLMEKDHYGLVLEYMHFGSSANFVKEFAVDMPLLLRITRQVLAAMVYLHSHDPPILHLDMKADNILINNHLNAKVCDFGLSEWKTVTCTVTRGMATSRRCTFSHIAPEVFENINAPSTKALDIYAFAITLWELFTGKIAYEGRGENLIRESVLSNQRPNLLNMPQNTIQIQAIMTRCWHQDQAARPQFSVLQGEFEGIYGAYAKHVPAAMKAIRRQIVQNYAVNDPEYIDTMHLDELEVGVTTEATPNEEAMDIPALPVMPMETEQPIIVQPEAHVTPEPLPPPVPIPVPVNGHKSSDPLVIDIDVKKYGYDHYNLKELLEDPVRMDVHKVESFLKNHNMDNTLGKYRDPVELQKFVNSKTLIRFEHLRSNSPFFTAYSAIRERHAKFTQQLVQTQQREEDSQKFYSYQKNQSPDDMNADEKRRYEKMLDLRVCSYGKKLASGDVGEKVIKALKEPYYLKQAMAQPESKPGEPQKFKVIDDKVKKLLLDPMILQIVLSQEPEILDNLMRQYPQLVMKLLADGKTDYKPARERRQMRRNERDIPFMMHMMGGPDPFWMGGDDDDDDEGPGFSRRGRRDPMRMMMGLMGGSRERRRQEEMMEQISADRRRKEKEEREKQAREEKERKEREKRKKEQEKRDKRMKNEKQKEQAKQPLTEKMEIEQLKQRTAAELKQKELQRLREIEKKRKEEQAEREKKENKGLNLYEVLTKPDLKREASATSPDAIHISMDQLSMEDAASPAKQTKDSTPDVPVVKAETQQTEAVPARPLPGASQAPSAVKQEPANTPSTSQPGAKGNNSARDMKEEKMEVDAQPTKKEPGMGAAGGFAPLEISHKHAGGAKTRIKMHGNMENSPNMQIGDRNTMVVTGAGAGGGRDNDGDQVPGKKKYGKTKKVNLKNGHEDEAEAPAAKMPRDAEPALGAADGSFAARMMAKMGYQEGKGLGKHSQGRVNIVEASTQRGRRGLGLRISGLDPSQDVKWSQEDDTVIINEEVDWLPSCKETVPTIEVLRTWKTIGMKKRVLDDETNFCSDEILKAVLSCKSVFDRLDPEEMRRARTRSNPYETIRGAFFLNRAAMKMANMDAVLDFMFTHPKYSNGKPMVGQNDLLYFADICAGPGGFSEYVLWRAKSEGAKGFGMTLKGPCDFKLEEFFAGPPEMFETFYGVGGLEGDGDIFRSDNQAAFKDFVLENTDGLGVHFVMADGGFSVEGQENIQEILSKQLYLCQFLVAISIIRPGGHFVCKLFDVFTPFSVGLVYLMYRIFEQVSLFKPVTSRPANSERYIVCKGLREDREAVRQYLHEINVELNQLGVASTQDVNHIVPMSYLQNNDAFYNYICNSNDGLGELQILNLRKIQAFAQNDQLYELRQAEVRAKLLEKWKVEDEVRKAPEKSSPKKRFEELIGGQEGCFSHTIEALTLDSLRNIKSVYDFRCVVTGSQPTNRIYVLGLGRSHVFKRACLPGANWTKMEDRLELPRDTLIEAEIVTQLKGEGAGQRKVKTLHALDALFLYGKDVRTLHFTDRLQKLRKFCKSITKLTRPDLVRVAVPEVFRLEEMTNIFQRLSLKRVKGGGGMDKLCYCPQDSHNNMFYQPSGVYIIKTVRDPWTMHLSRSQQKKYFFNMKTGQSDFHCPPDSIASANDTKLQSLFWQWDEGVKLIEGQPCREDGAKLAKADIMEYIHRKLSER